MLPFGCCNILTYKISELTLCYQGKETGGHGGIVRQKDTGYVSPDLA